MSEKHLETPSAPLQGEQPDNGAQNDEGAAPPKTGRRGATTSKIKAELELAQKVYLEKQDKPITELAKEFDLTVYGKAHKRVAQKEITLLAREVIAERLLPKALAILNKELNAGNYSAAKDVLFGSQVLEKGGKSTIEHVSKGSILDTVRKELIIEVSDVSNDESK